VRAKKTVEQGLGTRVSEKDTCARAVGFRTYGPKKLNRANGALIYGALIGPRVRSGPVI